MKIIDNEVLKVYKYACFGSLFDLIQLQKAQT